MNEVTRVLSFNLNNKDDGEDDLNNGQDTQKMYLKTLKVES
jgi:hypothetical protein